MSEPHLIRLRAGWTWVPLELPGSEPLRIDLPRSWPPNWTRPIRLRRFFNRPLRWEKSSRIVLRCESVPGLVRVWLNERELPESPAPEPLREWALPSDLPARNLLELDVVPPGDREGSPGDVPWGLVALAVHSSNSA
jgi:hypothetical protein